MLRKIFALLFVLLRVVISSADAHAAWETVGKLDQNFVVPQFDRCQFRLVFESSIRKTVFDSPALQSIEYRGSPLDVTRILKFPVLEPYTVGTDISEGTVSNGFGIFGNVVLQALNHPGLGPFSIGIRITARDNHVPISEAYLIYYDQAGNGHSPTWSLVGSMFTLFKNCD